MSKGCFLIIPIVPKGKWMEDIKKTISNCANNAGLRVYFDFQYTEPIFDYYTGTAIICSIADDPKFDNCDMLFLLDNCELNGRRNNRSLYERMQQISAFITALTFPQVELFIGDSGTLFEEYKTVETTVEYFSFAILQEAEQYELPPLHIILKEGQTGGHRDGSAS